VVEWQTRRTQNPVGVTPWGFKSPSCTILILGAESSNSSDRSDPLDSFGELLTERFELESWICRFRNSSEPQKARPDHPAGNFKQISQTSRALINFLFLAVRWKFRPPYLPFKRRSRTDLGLGIPLLGPNLVFSFFFEHLVNDSRQVST